MRLETKPRKPRNNKPWTERKWVPPPGESYMTPLPAGAAHRRDNDLWARDTLSAVDLRDPYRRAL